MIGASGSSGFAEPAPASLPVNPINTSTIRIEEHFDEDENLVTSHGHEGHITQSNAEHDGN
eukprot:2320217-Prorocentrum_lima.AAC.1